MRKGSIWIAGGLLLLAAALCLTIYNTYEQKLAEERTKLALSQILPEISKKADASFVVLPEINCTEIEKEILNDPIEIPDYILNPNMEMPKMQINGRDYVGVLSIPYLELELPVASTYSAANLKAAPCRYSGSIYLNNMVICAHNFQNHFGTIQNLPIGERICFTDIDGNRFYYTVMEMETLLPSQTKEMISSDWDMTLFTCTIGGRTRLTVRCTATEND